MPRAKTGKDRRENFATDDIARRDAYGSLLLVDLTGCGPLRSLDGGGHGLD
jgi:hypothetical protein